MNGVKIVLRHENAKVPTRADKGSVGYDLYAVQDGIVYPQKQDKVKTGISISFDGDCYGRIAPRSGLSINNNVHPVAGVIDASYRGEIVVVLFNADTNKVYKYKAGDRIAQLIFEKAYTPEFTLVANMSDLLASDRGEDGFGSSGV